MGCNSSKQQIREPTVLIQNKPIRRAENKPPSYAKFSHSTCEAEQNHNFTCEIVCDLFQFYPPMLFFKCIESGIDVYMDLIHDVAQFNDNRKGSSLKKKNEVLKTTHETDLQKKIENIIHEQHKEIEKIASREENGTESELFIKRIQHTHQFEAALQISIEKWNFKYEIIEHVQTFCREDEIFSILHPDLIQFLHQQVHICQIWYDRVVKRKDDWNKIRQDMKQALIESANRIPLTKTQSEDMLDTFSRDLIEVKKKFEYQLTKSLQSIGDRFLSETKQDFRALDVEIMDNMNNEGLRKTGDNSKPFIACLKRKIHIYKDRDLHVISEVLKMIVQLEEVIGHELMKLFSSYISDLDGSKSIVSQINLQISKTEKERNRISKTSLLQLETARKNSSKNSTNKPPDIFFQQLRYFIPEHLINDAKKQRSSPQNVNTSYILSPKIVESIFMNFTALKNDRKLACQSEKKEQLNGLLMSQEKKYIQTFQDIFFPEKLVNALDPVQEIRTFIAKTLFEQKFGAIQKLFEMEETLKTLIDLRGVLFLFTFENPTANVDPTQIEQIYLKTKSEGSRIVPANMPGHTTRNENQDLDNTRLASLGSSHRINLDLNLIAVDAAENSSKIRLQKEELGRKEENNIVVYHQLLQKQIDHEMYTLKGLISLLRLDFQTVEVMLQALSSLDNILIEDMVETLVELKGANKVPKNVLEKLLQYTNEYKHHKKQIEDYVLSGDVSSSFERKVQFKIPDNDRRPSSRSRSDTDQRRGSIPETALMRPVAFKGLNIYRASPVQIEERTQSARPQRRGLRAQLY